MDQRGDEVHTSETEAAAASKEGVVRWVLLIGTFLAIAFLTIIWVTGAFTQDEEDSYVNVNRQIEAQDDTDDRGMPIAPAIDASSTSASNAAAPSASATPSSAPTPGDAPAGDPRPDAQ